MAFIPVAEAVELVTGQRPSASTLWRWCSKGVRGRKLESFMVGGVRMTSKEAVESFIRFGDFVRGEELPRAKAKPDEIKRRLLDELGL